jgi:beta-phosphoglucomutase-like phosphatase (HAD superfamily)
VLKALIFDVDGTLADTERQGHRVAFNRAFAEAGLDWLWDETLYGELLAVAGGKERLRCFIDAQGPELPPGAAEPSTFINGLHGMKTRHYTTLVNSGGIPARPGIIRLLNEAREAGLGLAIATTTTPGNVHALLSASLGPDTANWFDVIGAGDIVPNKKPAPDIYEYVLAELKLESRQCLAFEDSENGLRAAQRAGIPTLVTVNDYTAGQDFGGALLVVDHLGEPERPLTCLSGVPWAGFGLVDVAALRRLHARGLVEGKRTTIPGADFTVH